MPPSSSSQGADSRRTQHRRWLVWLTILCRLTALIALGASIALRDGVAVALAGGAGGLLLVPFAWRRRAASIPNATYSAAADLVTTRAGAFPGQLSVAKDSIAWVPAAYSVRHGQLEVTISTEGHPEVILQSGPALLDFTLLIAHGGQRFAFLTRRSRSLRRAIDRFSQAPGGPDL